MKTLTPALITGILMVGTLTGCQTTPSVNAPMAQPITNNILQAYNWQLVDAKRSNGQRISQLFFNPAKPLTLNFYKARGADRVTFVNTCNNISAEYDIVNGDVALNNVMSTLMACPEPQASFDTATMALVQGTYSLGKNANNIPVLTIRTNDQVANFRGVAK